MNWLRLHQRSAVLLGLTVLVPALMYLYLVSSVLGLSLDYAAERGRLEPRIARIQGMLGQQELILNRAVQAREALRERVYPASEDLSALAASLQARLRQAFAEAGMRVTNSQVLPPQERESFQQVSVKLTVEGSLGALDTALSAVAALRPALLVESFDAYPARQRGRGEAAGQTVTAVIQMLALQETDL